MSAEKYVELLLKYKSQVTALICVLVATLCFVGGRMSVHIPPKAVVCEAEIKTVDKLFAQIKEAEKKHIEELRTCHDDEAKECQKRIVETIDDFNSKKPSLDCRICKAMKPQCEKKGLWK